MKECKASASINTISVNIPLFENYECKFDVFDVDFGGRTHAQLANPYRFNFHSFVFDANDNAEDGNLHIVRFYEKKNILAKKSYYSKIQFCTVKMCIENEACISDEYIANCPQFYTKNTS